MVLFGVGIRFRFFDFRIYFLGLEVIIVGCRFRVGGEGRR